MQRLQPLLCQRGGTEKTPVVPSAATDRVDTTSYSTLAGAMRPCALHGSSEEVKASITFRKGYCT